MKRNATATVSAFEQLEDRRLMSASSLDPSFDTDGIKKQDFLAQDHVAASCTQPDGKTLVVENADDAGYVVSRFNANGSVDTGFGQNGSRKVYIGAEATATGVAVTPDGHILVGGSADTGLSEYLFATRLTKTGAVDTGFGYLQGKNSGKSGSGTSYFEIDVPTFYGVQKAEAAAARGIGVSGDGSFYLGCSAGIQHGAGYHYDHMMAAIHVNADGKMDYAFGKNGVATQDADGGHETGYGGDAAYAIARQADGKILLAGVVDGHMAVERYTAAGGYDYDFGNYGAGVSIWDYANRNYNEADSIAIGDNGQIVVGGNTSIGNKGPVFAVSQLDKYGHLDKTFNGTGMAVQDITAGGLDFVRSVAIDHDNNVLAGGIGAINGNQNNYLVARYTPQGKPDSRWGFGGVAEVSFGNGYNSEFSDVLVTPTGRVTAVGTTKSGNTDKVALARFIGHAPKFSISFYQSGKEGGDNPAFLLKRDGDPYDGAYDVKLVYTGTAKAGTDYTAFSTVHFGVGQSTRVIELPVTNDSKKEGYESIRIDLGNDITYDIDGASYFTQVGLYDND